MEVLTNKQVRLGSYNGSAWLDIKRLQRNFHTRGHASISGSAVAKDSRRQTWQLAEGEL
jgi:hypothetical protein